MLIDEIAECKTIVWNGPLGVFEVPPFDRGTVAVAAAVAEATRAGKLSKRGRWRRYHRGPGPGGLQRTVHVCFQRRWGLSGVAGGQNPARRGCLERPPRIATIK